VGARGIRLFVVATLACGAVARADDMPGAVLELKFTPAPRAQIAIWLEDAQGGFIRTLELTEAVAFHGLGNRPGASEMNSGYRWPYGRREGVLPIWASRRAAASSAKHWKRVIFQDRTYEGLASRTSNDQSTDDYYCLSFNKSTTSRTALDAVSCASRFSSDKGRFLTAADVSRGYHEPFEDPTSHAGTTVHLPLESLYPPRMDVNRCTMSGTCFDHADVASFAADAREVMPEIDAVTMATPQGNTGQSVLFSLPPNWPKGQYVLWFEINVEGDYNQTYSATSLPTPTTPAAEWDSWATSYGYPYRGQPSVAFQLPFELADTGDVTVSAAAPAGRSSWDFWSSDYGALQSMTTIADDPSGAPGSGADRVHRDASGKRLTLRVQTLVSLPEPDPANPMLPDLTSTSSSGPKSGGGTMGGADAGVGDASMPQNGSGTATLPSVGSGMGAAGSAAMGSDGQSGSVVLDSSPQMAGPVGSIRQLELGHPADRLHAHEWITIRFLAVRSEQPVHSYEVRISTDPITDEDSFIRNGRPAKTASLDPEGAVSLKLPTNVAAGKVIMSQIGDLIAQSHYYVGVRATDGFNRHGAISVAQITTDARKFATVTPCFVATAAYGTPLAAQVGALRRLRDRQLLSNGLGRALVRAYYAGGPVLARELRAHETLRSMARSVLEPIVAVARRLDGD
jgi:hypothetical protein